MAHRFGICAAVDEAPGIAEVRASTGKTYPITCCYGPNGCVLDGTPLPEPMERIDQAVAHGGERR